MSYDIEISVKVEGCDRYAAIAEPEFSGPTYNLAKMFRACMDWDFKQGEYYPAAFALDKLCVGIAELSLHEDKYKQYDPPNGWGSTRGALRALMSASECIRCCAEEYEDYDFEIACEKYPIGCLYFSW